MSDTKVHHGGLMRCCLATLADYHDEDVEPGDAFACNYEADDEPKMILGQDYVWRWVGGAE